MASSTAVSAVNDDRTLRLPSETVRTVASLAIFVHLFGLALVFLTNSNGGQSDLVGRMKVGVPYFNQIWFNHPYDYHLTYAEPSDYDHYLVAEIIKDGQPTGQRVTLPPEDLGVGERRQRYQRLARQVARQAELQELGIQSSEDLLPIMIGGSLLKSHDAKQVTIECFRATPLFFDQMRSLGATAARAPEKAFTADVRLLPGFKEPQFFKKGVERDVAPVVRPSTSFGPGGSANSGSATGGPKSGGDATMPGDRLRRPAATTGGAPDPTTDLRALPGMPAPIVPPPAFPPSTR